jgi:hypothetical protein
MQNKAIRAALTRQGAQIAGHWSEIGFIIERSKICSHCTEHDASLLDLVAAAVVVKLFREWSNSL